MMPCSAGLSHSRGPSLLLCRSRCFHPKRQLLLLGDRDHGSESLPRLTAIGRLRSSRIQRGVRKDGAPSPLNALAQTPDGYLWLGTHDGLYRFDGVVFESYQSQSGGPFPARNVGSLLALPNGDLWIGFRSGGVAFCGMATAGTIPSAKECPTDGYGLHAGSGRDDLGCDHQRVGAAGREPMVGSGERLESPRKV
jgi:hypothetical protein